MGERIETPLQLLNALAAIFPGVLAEWEEGEVPETFHSVMLTFTPFFGRVAPSASPEGLRRLGGLINMAVAGGGLLENATSTCLLEHLHQIRAWKILKPHLSDLARRRSRA